MRAVREWKLEEVDDEARTGVLVRGDARVPVKGVLVEEEFVLETGESLVWLSQNSPYEEELTVYLLGRNGEVLDLIWAGIPYAPGLLVVQQTGKNWVEFSFFDEKLRSRLRVEEQGGWRISRAMGWEYGALLQRHRLVVEDLKDGR
jgi:hypothetical protein